MAHLTTEIRTDDGMCPAHVFHPDGDGPWPAVLFYMGGIGMRPTLHGLGERLAAAGYFVLMPDMFYRAGAYIAPDPKQLFSDEATRKEHFTKFAAPDFLARAMSDTRAFLAYLDTQPKARAERIGIVGYCMGGRLGLAAAGTFGDRIAAVAGFHPGHLATDTVDSPHQLAANMRAKIYIAAASDDPSFSDEQKQRLADVLGAAHVDHVIETYPAKHGWVPSDTPMHDAACAERHWTALFDFFGKTL